MRNVGRQWPHACSVRLGWRSVAFPQRRIQGHTVGIVQSRLTGRGHTRRPDRRTRRSRLGQQLDEAQEVASAACEGVTVTLVQGRTGHDLHRRLVVVSARALHERQPALDQGLLLAEAQTPPAPPAKAEPPAKPAAKAAVEESKTAARTTQPATSAGTSQPARSGGYTLQLASITSANSRCSWLNSVSASSCAMPRMPLSGVRSSWLIVARNRDLATLARSASCRRWSSWASPRRSSSGSRC